MKEYKKPTVEIIKLHIEENIASNTEVDQGSLVTVFDFYTLGS